MVTGARFGGTLVVVVVLLLALALAATGFFLLRDGPSGSDEPAASFTPQGTAEPATTDDANPANARGDDPDEEPGEPAESASSAAPSDGQPMGALEIQVAPGGARVALIGPDRFVHASTQFGTATLASLRSGDYVLSGTMEGYAAVTQEIRLAPGERRSIVLELTQVRSR